MAFSIHWAMGDTNIVFVSLPTMHGHKIVTWSQLEIMCNITGSGMSG